MSSVLYNNVCDLVVVLVSLGAIMKYHRLGGLNDRNLFSHNFGGWEIQDQGARKKWFLVRTPFLAYRQPTSHYVLTWPFPGEYTKTEET